MGIAGNLLVLLGDAFLCIDHHQHYIGPVYGSQGTHDAVALHRLFDLAPATHACSVDKDDKSTLRFTEDLRDQLGFLQYAPVLYASALTGQRVGRVTELVKYVAEQQSMRIKTSVLNELIRDAVSINPPPMHKGRRLKIMYMTQVDIQPPTFIIFVNDPELMHFSYLRFIENRLRESFGFEGTPLKLIVRSREEEE